MNDSVANRCGLASGLKIDTIGTRNKAARDGMERENVRLFCGADCSSRQKAAHRREPKLVRIAPTVPGKPDGL